MKPWACTPSSVLAARAARSMSPVAMCGTPKSSVSSAAWVPLPAPGGPRRIRSSSDMEEGRGAEDPAETGTGAHHPQRNGPRPAQDFRKPS